LIRTIFRLKKHDIVVACESSLRSFTYPGLWILPRLDLERRKLSPMQTRPLLGEIASFHLTSDRGVPFDPWLRSHQVTSSSVGYCASV